MRKLKGGWRAAMAVAILVAVPAAASCGERERARVTALVGVVHSTGLGEEAWAPYAEGQVELQGWRAIGQGELSRKLESGRGYRLGLDLERQLGPLVVLAAYRERDGGAWRKRGAWVGAGTGWRTVQLRVRQELGGNETTGASLLVAVGRAELQGAAYRYRPTFGGPRELGGTMLLGVRVGRGY